MERIVEATKRILTEPKSNETFNFPFRYKQLFITHLQHSLEMNLTRHRAGASSIMPTSTPEPFCLPLSHRHRDW